MTITHGDAATVNYLNHRLRVVSNFILAIVIVGRAKYTRARAKVQGDATRRERRKLCTLPAPQSPSPELETTRSLFESSRTAQTDELFFN